MKGVVVLQDCATLAALVRSVAAVAGHPPDRNHPGSGHPGHAHRPVVRLLEAPVFRGLALVLPLQQRHAQWVVPRLQRHQQTHHDARLQPGAVLVSRFARCF